MKMLTDTDEEEEVIQRVTKIRKHRSVLNRSPSLKKADSPRRKHRSPTKKRTDSIKLSKEEMKYQRFITSLKKETQIYLSKCLRENGFDPSGTKDFHFNAAMRAKRVHEIEKITGTMNNHRQRSMKFFCSNETKRMNGDVHNILTGPAMKAFYNDFIQPRKDKTPTIRRRLRPLDESILWSNEQE